MSPLVVLASLSFRSFSLCGLSCSLLSFPQAFPALWWGWGMFQLPVFACWDKVGAALESKAGVRLSCVR